MNFVERAQSLYEQEKTFEACITLANGLKMNPQEEGALDWFLQMYCEEIPRPGLESDVLRILQKRLDGADRFENLCAELEHLGAAEKYDALFDVVERKGIRFRVPTGPHAALAASGASAPVGSVAEEQADGAERWDRFSNPLDEDARRASPEERLPAEVSAPSTEDTPESPEESAEVNSPSEGFQLGTMDTLPDELRAQYAPTSQPSAVKPKQNWAAVGAAVLIVIAALAYYVLGPGASAESVEDPPNFAPVTDSQPAGEADPSPASGSGSGAE